MVATPTFVSADVARCANGGTMDASKIEDLDDGHGGQCYNNVQYDV